MAGNLKAHPALLSLYAARLPGLTKRDGKFWAKCIFHQEKTASLTVGTDDHGEFVFHCFGCGEGGDTIAFVQKSDGISFQKAKELVEKATGGNWEETKKKSDAIFAKLELESVPLKRYKLEDYVKFEIQLFESQEAQDWLFTERGITYDTARKLHFGYCKDLSQINSKPSQSFEPIKEKGWIITPALENNEVVCIEARSMVEKTFARKTGMDNKVLFGVDFISWDEPIYVVEGHFDQAIMLQAGYRVVSLPSSSVKLTPQMRDMLMTAQVVILAGDNDGGSGTDAMLKLWNELQERTYRLIWPKKMKDANETFLKHCERDIDKFKSLVENLTLQAYANPVPGIKSIQDILRNDQSESAEKREDRFKFGLTPLDKMANIFPGSVVYLSAASTGTGKTQITLQETLKAARKDNAVVLNYQTQLQGEEIGQIVTANLLAVERNDIKREDRLEAAKRLKGVQYYVGHDPGLSNSDAVLDLIESGIRRVGANIVVLDLINDIFGGDTQEIRAQQKAMRRIKVMAQKYLTVFFVIGQPRKVDPKNVGKPIDIYDAKGSETFVSEADVVFYMYRQPVKDMTETTEDRLSPEVQIRCMKARSKGKGSAFCKLFFLGKIATFREIIHVEEIDKMFSI